MRVVYVSPDGKEQYSRPRSINYNGSTYTPPTDEQLTAAGWTIEERPDPEPELPTKEELVEQALRYGADGGSPTYSINQEFEVNRKRDEDPESFAIYNARVEACIAWAESQPHK